MPAKPYCCNCSPKCRKKLLHSSIMEYLMSIYSMVSGLLPCNSIDEHDVLEVLKELGYSHKLIDIEEVNSTALAYRCIYTEG